MTGDAAPGLPASSGFSQFFGVSLNDGGDLVFSAFVAGPSIGAGDDEVIYRAPSGGVLTPLVREGDAATGAPGASYQSPGNAVQNNSGDYAFTPEIDDGGGSLGAVYVPGPTLFAVEGDAAPGAGGATWGGFTHLISPVLNDAGGVAFQANLSGTGFGSSIWGPGGGGTPTLVAKEGEQAAGLAAGVEYGGMIFDPLLNDTGRLAFSGQLGGSAAGESVLWLRDGTGAPSALVRGTDAAPDLGIGESVGSISLLELNDGGTVVFHSVIQGLIGPDDEALWRSSGTGAPTLLVREGDAAPGAANNATFTGLLSGRLSDNGTLAFAADLTGQLGQASRALYVLDPSDQLDILLEVGDAAPELAGVVIADLPFDPLIDAEGNLLFRALLGGAGVNAGNDLAAFYYDAVLDEIVLVAREGDTIEANPGDVRTIGTLFAPLLNDSDQIGLFVSFVGGGQGIYLANIPEPGSAALLALGCTGLAVWRRRAVRR